MRRVNFRGHDRVLHALNRVTFGPTPGEVVEVERVGLNRWFEQQLNPSAIDDSALEARLGEYPAMRMTIQQMESRYPGPGTIRQMIAGKIDLPADPTARAMAEDQIALYKIQKAKKEADTASAKAPDASATMAIPNDAQVTAGQMALDEKASSGE